MVESENDGQRNKEFTAMKSCLTCPHPVQNLRTYHARDRITGEVFEVEECLACALSRTRVPEDFDAGKYYPPMYYGLKNKRFVGAVETAIRMFRHRRARQLQRWSGLETGRVLDIGCGRGLMLAKLKENGWTAVGTESSSAASEYGRDVLGLDIKIAAELADCGFEDNAFDAVALWHVLEHQARPFEFLTEVRRILKPGGVLIAEVPNFGSWQAGMNKGRWIYTEVPRHLFHFSFGCLRDILGAGQWEMIYAGTSSLEFGFFGMVQSLLNCFSPEENCLFKLLGRNRSRPPGVSRFVRGVSVVMTFLFLVPCAVIGVILEGLSVLTANGGAARLIVRKI